ncbi:hypothetical protein B0H14DRAFT_2672012 [Mycena olivaceomarginata]|nr:hypothetical protein B0H14DRAFT_2672012 [Mycena olivaceomarginata]
MHPPYYVLASASAALVHPTIQYHYKDDPPLDLLPQPGEQVLVLDYDPETNAPPTIQSISPSISVTGLRVEEAPGAAAAAADEGVARNDRMFIIETTTAQDRSVDGRPSTRTLTACRPMDSSMTERKPPQTVLAQFKQRSVSTLFVPGN